MNARLTSRNCGVGFWGMPLSARGYKILLLAFKFRNWRELVTECEEQAAWGGGRYEVCRWCWLATMKRAKRERGELSLYRNYRNYRNLLGKYESAIALNLSGGR